MIILPVYKMTVLPGTTLFYRIDMYGKLTGYQPAVNAQVVMLFAKEDPMEKTPGVKDFYPIGATARISEIAANGYLALEVLRRINLDGISMFPGGSFDISMSGRREEDDLDREAVAPRVENIKKELVRLSEGREWEPVIKAFAQRWNTIEEIAATYSPWMVSGNEERYEALAEDSRAKRFDMLEKMLLESMEILKVTNQAHSAQESEFRNMYKESAIKKQMEYLQKELDEMHPDNVSDLRRLEVKLQLSPMNEDAKREGKKILNRLKSEGQNSPETGMLMDYLDLLTDLPWQKEPAEKISLDEAEKVLDKDHSGLRKVKRRILEQIAVMNLKGVQAGSILLFVGAPGTGKTSIGQSIAAALNRKYVRVSLGGVRDEADIRGHRRTYIGSMPGRIIDGVHKCGVSNPVMVLDEVDKISQSYNGDPASALLEVLDPEQNHTFTDHYLNVPYDLSDVFFICTANTTETIPEPLLNRMEVIPFQGYTPIEKAEIFRTHLLVKSMDAIGLAKDQLSVTDEAIEKVISEYTREAGVRGLKKRVDGICRGAAVHVTKEPEKKVEVTADNVGEFLDMNPVHRKNVKESAEAGIVTGMAWTQAGGDILFIEAVFTKGEGKLIITGQLGDVMKESAQIAVSLVKKMLPEKSKLFKENDLHIHVPDGATPKDGPSAGITLTTALFSLVKNIPVSPAVSMTGEVSLQGNVGPIGGLPEKLMAAQRAGVKKVFIPKENEADLKDVPAEVKDCIEILPVEKVTDVLENLKLM